MPYIRTDDLLLHYVIIVVRPTLLSSRKYVITDHALPVTHQRQIISVIQVQVFEPNAFPSFNLMSSISK